MDCVYCILQFIPWIVSIVLYNILHGCYLLYFTIYSMDCVYCILQLIVEYNRYNPWNKLQNTIDTIHGINCKVQYIKSM
jgi:hypothetical protein